MPESQELTTGAWEKILDLLWKAGIPQVVFTGGEPTLREDLVSLVHTAKHFVTGLITNGTRLAALAVPLCAASLDYVQVTIESADAAIHDRMTTVSGSHAQTTAGITQALQTGLQVVTNPTLTRENGAGFQPDDALAARTGHPADGLQHADLQRAGP